MLDLSLVTSSMYHNCKKTFKIAHNEKPEKFTPADSLRGNIFRKTDEAIVSYSIVLAFLSSYSLFHCNMAYSRATTALTAVLSLFCKASSSSDTSGQTEKHCVVPSKYAASNATADDSPAISAAFKQCSDHGTVTFSEGINYNVFTPLVATDLDQVIIKMNGNLHLPQNITYMQELYNQTTVNSDSDNLYWFTLSGTGIQYAWHSKRDDWLDLLLRSGLVGRQSHEWNGSDGRPHLMSFNTTGGGMQYFKSRKPIAWNVQLGGSDIVITDTIIDAYSVTGSFPFNTDGFDVAATDVTITNSVIFNGDDAIAVGSGSHNVLFQGGTIGYQSHGMSIGSLGQAQYEFANVSNIRFDDITVVNAVYASRFKSWVGGQGLAKNISWTNMRVYNVTFPIFVTQTYINQGGSQTQSGNGGVEGRKNNATVNMEDFT